MIFEVWDLRQMKSALKVFENLPNNYPQTNASFSPDEQLILTGTSVEKNGESGGLLFFFSRKKLELESRVGISPHLSVVRCAWHPKLNQVKVQIWPFYIFLYLIVSVPTCCSYYYPGI